MLQIHQIKINSYQYLHPSLSLQNKTKLSKKKKYFDALQETQ